MSINHTTGNNVDIKNLLYNYIPPIYPEKSKIDHNSLIFTSNIK